MTGDELREVAEALDALVERIEDLGISVGDSEICENDRAELVCFVNQIKTTCEGMARGSQR